MSAPVLPLHLVFRSAGHTCALPLLHVVETLRPLPVNPLAGAPPGVSGLSVIRGEPVPVVDVPILLGGNQGSRERWIVIRVGERRAALSVDTVLGIREFSPSLWSDLPPLVRDACPGVLDAVGALDEEMLLVLKTGGLVPDTVWESLAQTEA